jgi:hypothetical protein
MAISRDDARSSLQDELRPIFDQLVEEYRFHATVLHGSPFVSYAILAALVKDGWRPPAGTPNRAKSDVCPKQGS